jgi:hypothetical protein
MQNKRGLIVSKKKHALGLKAIKKLQKYDGGIYKSKKGVWPEYARKKSKKRKMRGGDTDSPVIEGGSSDKTTYDII